MHNLNVVVISGNLTRDPELHYTSSDALLCKLRVTVNGRREDAAGGHWVEKPNYFDAAVWGRQAESCANYLAKGTPVAVEGRLDWRQWEDKEGAKRQSV